MSTWRIYIIKLLEMGLKPQDFGDPPSNAFVFRVYMKRGEQNIAISGYMDNDGAELTNHAYLIKRVSVCTLRNLHGNQHFDLVPIRLTELEIGQAKNLIKDAAHRWQTHDYEHWLYSDHPMHGYIARGAYADGLDALSGRITGSTLTCKCGESFHGPPNCEWKGMHANENDLHTADRSAP